MVLRLIRAGKGTNELVDEHRGKLNRSLLDEDKLPSVPDSFTCVSGDEASKEDSDEEMEAEVNSDVND